MMSCKSDMVENRAYYSASLCGHMARLNLLFALMLAVVSYPSIHDVAIGDNGKSEKEEKG